MVPLRDPLIAGVLEGWAYGLRCQGALTSTAQTARPSICEPESLPSNFLRMEPWAPSMGP